MPRTREEARASLLDYARSRPERVQHMLDLDEEFPSVGMFEPWCISAEVGPGWKHILRPVLRVLAKHGCQAGQVKAKFCKLTVYWHHPDVPWRDLPAEVRAEIRTVMEVAEELSLHMCEDCGVPVVEGAGRQIAGARLCSSCRKIPRW